MVKADNNFPALPKLPAPFQGETMICVLCGRIGRTVSLYGWGTVGEIILFESTGTEHWRALHLNGLWFYACPRHLAGAGPLTTQASIDKFVAAARIPHALETSCAKFLQHSQS
jgi:hypothetical protein